MQWRRKTKQQETNFTLKYQQTRCHIKCIHVHVNMFSGFTFHITTKPFPNNSVGLMIIEAAPMVQLLSTTALTFHYTQKTKFLRASDQQEPASPFYTNLLCNNASNWPASKFQIQSASRIGRRPARWAGPPADPGDSFLSALQSLAPPTGDRARAYTSAPLLLSLCGLLQRRERRDMNGDRRFLVFVCLLPELPGDRNAR